MSRIPELEQELVAAAARLQSPRRLVRPTLRAALAAGAVAVVVVLAVVNGSENGDERRRQPTPAGTQQIAPDLDDVDREAGVRFSLDGHVLTVRLLPSAPGQTRSRVNGARIRATCGRGFTEGPGPGPGPEPRQTRTRIWPAGSTRMDFRFHGDISAIATWCRLEDPVVGHVAFVKFGAAPAGARLSPEQQIERIGNKWARLFAAAPNPDACAGYDESRPYREVAAKYMAQPACEQVVCERVGRRPIEDCTPLSPGLQRSFADATVEDVVVKGHRAGARFSNGETVELGGVQSRNRPDPRAPAWLIDKIGGNAGRKFFE